MTNGPDITDPLMPSALPRRKFASARTIFALMLREMSTRYGQSAGGYIWALLHPFGTILILAIGFSLLVRAPSLGNNFILFYATGFLPFFVFQTISDTVARAMRFNRPLLFYPAVTWVDAVFARFILNLLTDVMLCYILLTGIIAYTQEPVLIAADRILIALGMAAILGFGIGVLNCVLLGLFPVWEQLWAIIMRPMFLASGVIFIYEDMPQMVQNILYFNPLLHVTGEMRAGFYPMYNPEYVSRSFVLAVALIPSALGMLLLRKHHRKILEML